MKKVLFTVLTIVLFFLTNREAKAQTIVFSNGFENWTNNVPLGWVGTQTNLEADSIIKYSNNAHSDSFACRLVNRESITKKFSSSGFPIVSGTSYIVSFWIRGSGNITAASVFSGTSTALYSITGIIDTAGWVNRIEYFNAPVSTTTAELVLTIKQTKLNNDDLQIDDVQIFKATYAQLDTNLISATINSTGVLFNTPLFNSGFEVPKGNGTNTIFANNIWIGGNDDSGQLHLAAETWGMKDFFFGPVATNYDSSFLETYNKIWKVDKSTINNHIANYMNGGYVVPASISSWPGNGNTANGEAAMLAPFYDINGNNIYEPALGDYPIIRGDQAIFFMVNDDYIHATGGKKLGIEVHGMAYSFASTSDSALNQTVFVNYTIINRSTNNYQSLYFGSFADMDLGDATNDYIGCDSSLNMFYTYNGSNSDNVYGTPPPAQGAIFLNYPISKFVYYTNGAGITGDPDVAEDYYNYLMGRWKDGTQMSYGSTGYGGTTPSSFMFSGRPEFSLGWTEVSSGNAPGDRRGVMSVGPLNLATGESICFDIAFPYARDFSGTNLTSIALLRQRAQSIKTFYNFQVNNECITNQQTNGHINGYISYSGGIFPTTDIEVKLLDTNNTGSQVVLSTNTSASGFFSFPNPPQGSYFLKVNVFNQSLYPNILNTFYDSTYKWSTATLINYNLGDTLNLNFKMYEKNTPAQGNGKINGKIIYNSVNKSINGEPIPGAEITLEQEPEDEPIMATTSGNDGTYDFLDIPSGNYSLYVDIPNLPLVSTYLLVFNSTDSVYEDINFYVDTTTNVGIYNDTILAIYNLSSNFLSLSVYPNPTFSILNIEYQLNSSNNVNITLFDNYGKTIYTFVNSKQEMGKYSSKFNFSKNEITSGIYFLKVTIDNEVYIKKLIISK